MSLQSLGLSDTILRTVLAEGYTEPTPIQAQAIPHVLAGHDLFGCAQTGTGKTAAFALPILHALDLDRRRATPRAPRVLVLSPTRELASQIGRSFATYGQNVAFRQTVVYGGVSQAPQTRALSKGVHVLIATPGRLLDLMNQKQLTLSELEVFVLDEADRMLDMGFMPDLKKIISTLPAKRQSLFFSATCPPKIGELANGLLRNPVRIEVTPPASTVELIEQRVMFVSQDKKRDLLAHVLRDVDYDRMLVFTRTKHGADKVARQLERTGVSVDAIHGDKSQAARERTLARFRGGRLNVLIATDVAARGIDIEGITHVINFDLPREPENYVHRIGRTGRAGAEGMAIAFCDASELGALRAIEHTVKRKIQVDAAHPYHEAHKEAPRGAKRFGGPSKFRGGKSYGGKSSGGGGKSYGRPYGNAEAGSASSSKPSGAGGKPASRGPWKKKKAVAARS